MNKLLRLAAVAASLSLLAGLARADRYPIDEVLTAPAPKSSITRADTLADLQIWRESGLAAFERLEGLEGERLPGYALALARYQALMASERFAELKAHFASSRAPAPPLQIDLRAAVPSRSGLTRAAVRAELDAWRQAGLAAFESSESNAYRSEAQYQAAKARYEQLRQLPAKPPG